jgi:hypothetical protein
MNLLDEIAEWFDTADAQLLGVGGAMVVVFTLSILGALGLLG